MSEISKLSTVPLGQLLMRCYRDFSARVKSRLDEEAYEELGLMHIAVLAQLDESGLRNTLVAEKAGISKQAVGKVIQELEKRKFVTREADPSDGRAQVVKLTGEGKLFFKWVRKLKAEIEGEYEELIGERAYRELRKSMVLLLDGLGG